MDIKQIKNKLITLSLIFGCLSIILGSIEVLVGLYNIFFGNIRIPLFCGDVFGGISLLAIGIVYLLGFKKAKNEDIKALSYIFTASIIGLGIGIVSILVLLAHLIVMEFYGINIYIVFGILSIIPYRIIKNFVD
ncbi:hypothetical protein ACPB8Q_04480 [Methanocaldococcus indicus]|uniref:hypothetical protein n=1 Tax=Methanocaldococcus indicus TaxID=213231 RepID=UPI003C6D2D7B